MADRALTSKVVGERGPFPGQWMSVTSDSPRDMNCPINNTKQNIEIGIARSLKDHDTEESGPPGSGPPVFGFQLHPCYALFQLTHLRYDNSIGKSTKKCKNTGKRRANGESCPPVGPRFGGGESACNRAFRGSLTASQRLKKLTNRNDGTKSRNGAPQREKGRFTRGVVRPSRRISMPIVLSFRM